MKCHDDIPERTKKAIIHRNTLIAIATTIIYIELAVRYYIVIVITILGKFAAVFWSSTLCSISR